MEQPIDAARLFAGDGKAQERRAGRATMLAGGF